MLQQPVSSEPLSERARKRSVLLRWSLSVVVAVAVLAAGGAVLLAEGDTANDPTAPMDAGAAAPLFAEEDVASAAAGPPAELAPASGLLEPLAATPADFEIGITVLSEECFGSVGCNVSFRIQPRYLGTTPLAEDGRMVTVVYRVLGGDGERTGRFTIIDGTAGHPSVEFISTAAAGARLTAEATRVF